MQRGHNGRFRSKNSSPIRLQVLVQNALIKRERTH